MTNSFSFCSIDKVVDSERGSEKSLTNACRDSGGSNRESDLKETPCHEHIHGEKSLSVQV